MALLLSLPFVSFHLSVRSSLTLPLSFRSLRATLVVHSLNLQIINLRCYTVVAGEPDVVTR